MFLIATSRQLLLLLLLLLLLFSIIIIYTNNYYFHERLTAMFLVLVNYSDQKITRDLLKHRRPKWSERTFTDVTRTW